MCGLSIHTSALSQTVSICVVYNYNYTLISSIANSTFHTYVSIVGPMFWHIV